MLISSRAAAPLTRGVRALQLLDPLRGPLLRPFPAAEGGGHGARDQDGGSSLHVPPCGPDCRLAACRSPPASWPPACRTCPGWWRRGPCCSRARARCWATAAGGNYVVRSLDTALAAVVGRPSARVDPGGGERRHRALDLLCAEDVIEHTLAALPEWSAGPAAVHRALQRRGRPAAGAGAAATCGWWARRARAAHARAAGPAPGAGGGARPVAVRHGVRRRAAPSRSPTSPGRPKASATSRSTRSRPTGSGDSAPPPSGCCSSTCAPAESSRSGERWKTTCPRCAWRRGWVSSRWIGCSCCRADGGGDR